MSESSQDKVSKILEQQKQKNLQLEQNLQNLMNKRLDDAFVDFNSALNNIMSRIESSGNKLINNLLSQATPLIDDQVTTANQNLVQSVNQLEQTQQMLSKTTDQIQLTNQKLGILQFQILESQHQSQKLFREYANNLVEQAKTHMKQSETVYQGFYQAQAQKQANLRVKAMMIGMITFVLALIPTLVMLGMTYYSSHLMSQQQQQLAQVEQSIEQQQQQLALISAKIQQTPAEARALTMVTVLPNDQDPKQMLIIPKNQQQVKFGLNPKRQLVLQIAPDAPN
ncbi:hypothetical protein ENHYD8BJ_160003 [Enhydrobacter sp. 8BJ]|nr:hypothetical protein ENHYD8BJ_160003 [Enhydrobacter sp. 8BJ]